MSGAGKGGQAGQQPVRERKLLDGGGGGGECERRAPSARHRTGSEIACAWIVVDRVPLVLGLPALSPGACRWAARG